MLNRAVLLLIDALWTPKIRCAAVDVEDVFVAQVVEGVVRGRAFVWAIAVVTGVLVVAEIRLK